MQGPSRDGEITESSGSAGSQWEHQRKCWIVESSESAESSRVAEVLAPDHQRCRVQDGRSSRNYRDQRDLRDAGTSR
jgi:hypothetical protein